MDTRKRFVPEDAFNAYSCAKKPKQEMGTSSTGMGSNSKPFMKFFRAAVTQKVKLGPTRASIYVASPPPIQSGPSQPALKTRLCNKYNNTAEGCKYGDKCHFAHGKSELGKPVYLDDDPRVLPAGRFGGQIRHSSLPSGFDDPLTFRISVAASLAGAIIGNGGVNLNKICLKTDVEPIIREHESDPNLMYIELEGYFEQVRIASAMLIGLIGRIGPVAGPPNIPRALVPQPSTY